MGDVNQRLFLSRALPRADGPVLEVGSRDYGNTTTFRDVFTGGEYIGIDLSPGKDVDRVLDLATGTGDLRDGHFALAICCSVLEHVRRPWEMAANITRLLRPGGALYVAVPWVWRYHAYPDDYYRFSFRGIMQLFPDFEWGHLHYSTTVAGEFLVIKDDCLNIDDIYSIVINRAEEKRKYMPYLMLHMLGTNRIAASRAA